MADPDYTIIDGFDKYAQNNSELWRNSPPTPNLPYNEVFNGEWEGNLGQVLVFDDPIGSPYGQCVRFNGDISRALPTTYERVVGGVCMSLRASIAQGMQVQLGTSATGLSLQWNVDGNFYLRRGADTSTIIATGTGSVFPLALNSTHFISWDATLKSVGGRVKIWIDGELVIDYSGDTTATTDGISFVLLYSYNSRNRFDHFYMDCYLTGGGSELPFLTNPVVYTDNPESDSSANFTIGTTILGDPDILDNNLSTQTSGNNITRLRRVQAKASGNLDAIWIMPWASSTTVKAKAALYADSSGTPGALLGSSTEVTGFTAQTAKGIPFSVKPAVVAGTWYWIAFRTDISVNMLLRRASGGGGQQYTATYANAFLNPAASLSVSAEILMFGVISGQTSRADTLDVPNFATQFSYTYSATVGQEDLFNPPAVPGTPTGIHHVSVKVFGLRSDAGPRTVDLEIKSGAVTSAGLQLSLIHI